MRTFNALATLLLLGLASTSIGCVDSAPESAGASTADDDLVFSEEEQEQRAVRKCAVMDICQNDPQAASGGGGNNNWWTGLRPGDPLAPFVPPVTGALPGTTGIIITHGNAAGSCVSLAPTAQNLQGWGPPRHNTIIVGSCYAAVAGGANGCSFLKSIADEFNFAAPTQVGGCTGKMWYYADGTLHCQGQMQDPAGNVINPFPGVSQGQALPAGPAVAAC